MAELTPLFMDIDSVYSGDELGLPYRDILGEGVIGANDLLVAQRAGTPNLSVDVAAGAAWVLGDTNGDAQPLYRVRNDAVVNKGISPDPSNPRKVLVVAQVTDETFAGTGRNWQVLAIHGTPAASPAEPALPASALPLALVDVPAGALSIVTANITDRRARASVGGGQAQNGGAMAVIEDKLLTAAAATLDFQNIPAGYTNLRLVISARGDGAGANTDTIQLRFNNDSGSSYSSGARIVVAGSTPTTVSGVAPLLSNSILAGVAPLAGTSAGIFGNSDILIPSYASTSMNKNVQSVASCTDAGSGPELVYTSGRWGANAVVNRITLMLSAGSNFIAGTRATLYGLR